MTICAAAPPLHGANPLLDLWSWLCGQALSQANRPLRLQLGGVGTALDGALMVQRFDVQEEICAEQCLSMRLLCVSTRADLPAPMFLGLPVSLQVVTERGGLRSFNGVVVEAVPGQSDGGVQSWMLKAVDVLGFMAAGRNSRVFRCCNVVDITRTVLREWLRRSPALARAFDFDIARLNVAALPEREFTLQWDESDDQRVVLADLCTQAVLSGRRYRLTVEDGKVIDGISDANGRTESFTTSIAFALYTVEILD